MQALPLILSALVAFAIAPSALHWLAEGPLRRANYRGKVIACPLGVVIVAAAVLSLGPLALVAKLTDTTVLRPELQWVALFVLGVAVLGLIDDALAGGARGLRGHARALAGGQFSTGALKAVGTTGLALYVMELRGADTGRLLLGAGVLVLSTHTLNLVDLRPGRAVKLLLLLGASLTVGTSDLRPLWALGPFTGPALVVGLYDLRERGLLGDTGSGVLGALAGAWLVLSVGVTGQIVALVVLAAITLYGERSSLSDAIERTPLLRELDSLGRAFDATGE